MNWSSEGIGLLSRGALASESASFIEKRSSALSHGGMIMRENNPLTPEASIHPAVNHMRAETTAMNTVLIVEDSRPMQRTLQRLFESDSLQVQIASDGPTGLEFFRKQTPCAVVLDLKLPGMSGKELCREFKALAASVP